MAKLINFNTTTFSIAMSKNTGPENLAQELAVLPQALKQISLSRDGQAVILARLVRGLTSESWQQVCHVYPLNQWLALPVPAEGDPDEDAENLRVDAGRVLPVTPFREVAGALTKSMFISLLQREILRLSRNGGSLSLVAATLASRRSVQTALGEAAVNRLDALLGATMLDRLDVCDALGMTRKGIFVCSLPGFGQLAARHFAEKCQKAFECSARPFFVSGSTDSSGTCAIGIVNIMQGEACTVADLLKRARTALDAALRKQGGYIHQESAMAPFEGTTLVHSSEKRFLFFGGDPS